MRSLLTRRRILASGIAFPSGVRALASSYLQAHHSRATGTQRSHTAAAKTSASRWLFLGTDKGEGIYRASWDSVRGRLGTPELAVATDRPDFFAMHPSLPVLYTVNSVNGSRAGVSAYRLDPSVGALTLLNQLPTHGDGPCAVSVDRTGRMAFAANYGGGSLSAFALAAEGAVQSNIGIFTYKQAGHGPVKDRQEAAHLHCATLAPGNEFVVVCDLGDDLILAFPIAPSANSTISAPLRIAARPGSGPRHVAFHPNGRWMYCIHELDCTVDLYDWTPDDKHTPLKLRPDSTVSTLGAAKVPQGDTASEVSVSDDGRFVYVCTRGENSLVVYKVDPQTGTLAAQQHLSCGGAVPRYFALDPSRRWLVCCNQGDSTVTVFAHDAATGHLGKSPQTFKANTPMFCLWV